MTLAVPPPPPPLIHSSHTTGKGNKYRRLPLIEPSIPQDYIRHIFPATLIKGTETCVKAIRFMLHAFSCVPTAAHCTTRPYWKVRVRRIEWNYTTNNELSELITRNTTLHNHYYSPTNIRMIKQNNLSCQSIHFRVT